MKKKTSIYDVAKAAGVSASTVSRAINNDPRIAAATANKIQHAMTELGYIPRKVSQRPGYRRTASRTRRHNQIALLYSMSDEGLNTNVYSKVLQGVVDTATQKGINLILRRCADISDAAYVPAKIDGAILFSLFSQGLLLKKIYTLPCVRVMGLIKEDDFFDHVSYDNDLIGVMAAEYLLSKGVNYFASLNIPIENELLNKRVASFISRVERSGYKCHLVDLASDTPFPPELSCSHPPIGFFAPEDQRLIQALAFFEKNGFSIGQNLLPVGCNNNQPLLESLGGGIPSIDLNCLQIGAQAVLHLLDKISSPYEYRKKIIIDPFISFGGTDN